MAVDPRYQPQLRATAKRLYEKEKLSIRAVAARMGLSKTRIEELLNDAGVKRRARGPVSKKKKVSRRRTR